MLINIANHREVITTLLATQWKLLQGRFLAHSVMGEQGESQFDTWRRVRIVAISVMEPQLVVYIGRPTLIDAEGAVNSIAIPVTTAEKAKYVALANVVRQALSNVN